MQLKIKHQLLFLTKWSRAKNSFWTSIFIFSLWNNNRISISVLHHLLRPLREVIRFIYSYIHLFCFFFSQSKISLHTNINYKSFYIPRFTLFFCFSNDSLTHARNFCRSWVHPNLCCRWKFKFNHSELTGKSNSEKRESVKEKFKWRWSENHNIIM